MRWLRWLFRRRKDCTCKGWCECGKGETNIVQPTAPAQPSTAEAVQAYVQSLPQMYAAQLQYAPQLQQSEINQYMTSAPALAAMQNQLQMQYAPQEAAQAWDLQQQYAPQYAAQQQQLQQLYEPEAAAAKAQLGSITSGDYMSTAPWMQSSSQALGSMQNLYSGDYLTNYNPAEAPGMQAATDRLRQESRSAWADRGLGQGGNSAYDEAKVLSELQLPYAQQQEQMRTTELARRQSTALGMAQMDIGTQDTAYNRYLQEIGRRQNVGLSLAGRYAVPTQQSITTPQVQTPSVTPTNLMQSYTPSNIMNYMQQGYGTYAAASRPLGYTQSGGLFGGLFG
jgi:hypothetical protein